MSISGADELVIRKAIADKIALVAGAETVVPSPIYFSDKSDFWATVAPKVTQKDIETSPVEFCAISYLRFEDITEEGCEDEPMVALYYNFHVFREYERTREDETPTPDEFLKKVLKAEREFMNVLFGVREAFLGIQPLPIAELPDNYSVETNSLTQEDFADEKEPNRYVGFTDGFSADLVARVEVLIS